MSLSTKGPSNLFVTALRSARIHADPETYPADTKWHPLSSASCKVCDKPITWAGDSTFPDMRFRHANHFREDNVSSIGTRGINYTVEHFRCQTLDRSKVLTLPDEATFEQELRKRIKVKLSQQTEPSSSELTKALKKTNAGFTGDWKYLGSGIQSLHLLAGGPTGESSDIPADGTRDIGAKSLATILFRDVTAVQNSESGIQDQSQHIDMKKDSMHNMEEYIDGLFEVSVF